MKKKRRNQLLQRAAARPSVSSAGPAHEAPDDGMEGLLAELLAEEPEASSALSLSNDSIPEPMALEEALVAAALESAEHAPLASVPLEASPAAFVFEEFRLDGGEFEQSTEAAGGNPSPTVSEPHNAPAASFAIAPALGSTSERVDVDSGRSGAPPRSLDLELLETAGEPLDGSSRSFDPAAEPDVPSTFFAEGLLDSGPGLLGLARSSDASIASLPGAEPNASNRFIADASLDAAPELLATALDGSARSSEASLDSLPAAEPDASEPFFADGLVHSAPELLATAQEPLDDSAQSIEGEAWFDTVPTAQPDARSAFFADGLVHSSPHMLEDALTPLDGSAWSLEAAAALDLFDPTVELPDAPGPFFTDAASDFGPELFEAQPPEIVVAAAEAPNPTPADMVLAEMGLEMGDDALDLLPPEPDFESNSAPNLALDVPAADMEALASSGEAQATDEMLAELLASAGELLPEPELAEAPQGSTLPPQPPLELVIRALDQELESVPAFSLVEAPAAPHKQYSQLDDYVVFSLCGADYAVPVKDVAEIGRIPAIARVPNCPEFVRGLTNLRGEVVPVLSLQQLLGLQDGQQSSRGRVLFLQAREGLSATALLVDEVKGIQRIQSQQLEQVTGLMDDKVTSVLRGVHGRGDRLLNILDLGQLFQLQEIVQLENR